MANLGEITETIVSDQVLLKLGVDSYGQLTNLRFVSDSPETIKRTTNGQVVKFHGAANIYVDATLLATPVEVISLMNKNRTNGAYTAEAWSIVGTAKDGSTVTISFNAVLPRREFFKPELGAVEFPFRLSITDGTVTVA